MSLKHNLFSRLVDAPGALTTLHKCTHCTDGCSCLLIQVCERDFKLSYTLWQRPPPIRPASPPPPAPRPRPREDRVLEPRAASLLWRAHSDSVSEGLGWGVGVGWGGSCVPAQTCASLDKQRRPRGAAPRAGSGDVTICRLFRPGRPGRPCASRRWSGACQGLETRWRPGQGDSEEGEAEQS